MFLKEFFHWSYQFVNRFQNKKIEKMYIFKNDFYLLFEQYYSTLNLTLKSFGDPILHF